MTNYEYYVVKTEECSTTRPIQNGTETEDGTRSRSLCHGNICWHLVMLDYDYNYDYNYTLFKEISLKYR